MKKTTIIVIAFFILSSCQEKKEIHISEAALAELKAYDDSQKIEKNTKEFIKNYVNDANSIDWKTKLPQYLSSNINEFVEEHSAYRNSFHNYKSTIKHLTVSGNEGTVWLSITATYAENYDFENSGYGDELFNGIDAKNQNLTWDEIWYFNVVDGKFGDKWDFMKDNYKIMKDLKAAE
ncbi:hypothetical protein JQC67_16840 [Aurantibacter crassamenti]|uniref:hypothetical protein n=1 Tax=Aurantibacter crassamenti TaxID=1837375 RepID=UPI0019398B57|nr:hypothetical protein [Aurantibacter crassamenti]MBM1107824.1 hypothetical protein [Aurantibacter crassamenti]